MIKSFCISMLLLSACTAVETTAPPACGDGIVDPGEECDDGNVASGDGCSATCRVENGPGVTYKTAASWSLVDLATKTETSCPPGFDTAAIHSQPVDAGGQPAGTPVIDLFDCAAKTGTTSALPAGRYQTFVAITDANGQTTYAESTEQILDLTSADQTFATEIATDGGYFAMRWHLVGDTSNTALTCGGIGSTGVEAISTEVDNSENAVSDIFHCVDGVGLTAPLLAGTYTVSIAALDANNASLGTAPALTNQEILDHNRVTDLGSIDIPIAGQ